MSALFHGEMTSDEDAHTLNSYILPTMILTLFHLFCYKWKAQQVELQNNKRAEPLKKKKKKEAHEQSKSVLENQIQVWTKALSDLGYYIVRASTMVTLWQGHFIAF